MSTYWIKFCKTCGCFMPAENFPLNKRKNKDGVRTVTSKCQECTRTASQRYYRTHHIAKADLGTVIHADSQQCCSKCKQMKSSEMFNINFKTSQPGKIQYLPVCKQCQANLAKKGYLRHKEEINIKRRQQRAANPQHYQTLGQVWRLQHRFHVALEYAQKNAQKYGHTACLATEEAIQEVFTGYCHICGISESECSRKLCLDHSHESGQFRGWICDACNRALGLLKDDVMRALAVADYLNSAYCKQTNSNE